MRLLVCGSRTYSDYPILAAALNHLTEGEQVEVVINGGMLGADAMSSYWAYEHKINTICVGAQWGDLGSAAGPQRNVLMLDHHPTLVVAFYDKPRTESRGTAHIVKIARATSIPVAEVGP
jgi:hypothetical protein